MSQVKLRPFVDTDLARFVEYFLDEDVRRFLFGGAPGHHAEREFSKLLDRTVRGQNGVLAIADADTDELLGSCGLFEPNGSDADAELVVGVIPNTRRSRVATEACRARLSMTPAGRRIVARVRCDNGPSLKLVRKLGFEYDDCRVNEWKEREQIWVLVTGRGGESRAIRQVSASNSQRDRLFRHATTFRIAVKCCRHAASGSVAAMRNFPEGVCKVTSMLLARYLTEAAGLREGEVNLAANGMRGMMSHAWLEVNQFVVDITADQFGDGQPAVLVTESRSWHDRFVGHQLFAFREFMQLNRNYAIDFDEYYRVVQKRLSGADGCAPAEVV